MKLFFEILDAKRVKILSLLKNYKSNFYLAGGTGLALQIGHRKSIDFDFFTDKEFYTNALFNSLKETFSSFKIKIVQEQRDTLSVILKEDIKLSFFEYRYRLIKPLIKQQSLNIASLEDIGCMKLQAIVSRATLKDYVDIYYILDKIPLKKLLNYLDKKFEGELDKTLVMKSLTYFDDIVIEPIKFAKNKKISFNVIKERLLKEVSKYLNKEIMK